MRVLVLLGLFVASSSMVAAQAQSPDAVVESVKGKAWKRDDVNQKPVTLKPGEGLLAGQWVSCPKDCKELVISYCNVKRPIQHAPTWRQILSISCSSVRGTRGGGAKGESVLVLSPKDSEKVQPETFSLRWRPFESRNSAELTLKVYLGEQLWGPKKVDGRRGTFDSGSLRSALRNAQQAGHLILAVTLDDEKISTQRVKFKLISVDEQQDLQNDLRKFKKEKDRIVRAIGQGSALGDYELYAEAAREFERALSIARTNKMDKNTLGELKALSIMANYKAYNDDRVKQLCKSWEFRDHPPPDPCSKIQ
jgi:hypothetical protein